MKCGRAEVGRCLWAMQRTVMTVIQPQVSDQERDMTQLRGSKTLPGCAGHRLLGVALQTQSKGVRGTGLAEEKDREINMMKK